MAAQHGSSATQAPTVTALGAMTIAAGPTTVTTVHRNGRAIIAADQTTSSISDLRQVRPISDHQDLAHPASVRRGFGPPGGMGRGGVDLDPLVGLDSDRMPLRSKLLAVPALKARYLEYVRRIAQDSLDWNKLGPVVADYRALIADAVERDTRKLSTFEAFQRATADEPAEGERNERETSLRTFADKRRAYLLRADRSNCEARPARRPNRRRKSQWRQKRLAASACDPDVYTQLNFYARFPA